MPSIASDMSIEWRGVVFFGFENVVGAVCVHVVLSNSVVAAFFCVEIQYVDYII